MEQATPFTIVIADDDHDDRELLTALFAHNDNFAVLGSLASGIEVFDEISRKKNVPDILLIDMYMPYFTGIEIVKALETMEAAPTMIKFVISTAINREEKEKHLNNPYVVFLKKPVTVDEMKALPNIVLENMMNRMSYHV